MDEVALDGCVCAEKGAIDRFRHQKEGEEEGEYDLIRIRSGIQR